jgi:hypothetical protein
MLLALGPSSFFSSVSSALSSQLLENIFFTFESLAHG